MMRRFINLKSLVFAISALAFTIIFIACQPEKPHPVAVAPERATEIGDIYTRARDTGHLDLLDSIYSPEVAVHDAGYPTDICGLEALKEYYNRSHTAIPDLSLRLEDMHISGDWIIWLWRFDGTNTGPLGEMPATGKSVSFSGVAIDRIENNMIAEEWVYWNTLDLYSQLGFKLQPPTIDSSMAQ